MIARRPPTFGVEEEFLLLDPAGGRPVPAAPGILRLLGHQPGMQAELMRYQLETATGICETAEDLRAELRRLRRLGSEAARSCGCRLVAIGISPYGSPGLAALTERPRYQEMARRYPALAAASGTCACQVHVGIRSRDLGVEVLARLRPWLATLLAVSANSPVEGGHDTGWASRRYAATSRWPTAAPPAIWTDAAAYDRAVRKLVQRGAAMDERSIYLLARLSPRYPTVEVRVADVCPDIDTTMLVAVLVRAIVATCTAESQAGKPLPRPDRATIRSGLEAAARHGLAGSAIDPWTGNPIDAWKMLERLVDHCGRALADLGDDRTASQLLAVLRTRGGGAERQRNAWNRTGPPSPACFVAELAATTWETPLAVAP